MMRPITTNLNIDVKEAMCLQDEFIYVRIKHNVRGITAADLK